jgi:hypothetical protein
MIPTHARTHARARTPVDQAEEIKNQLAQREVQDLERCLAANPGCW